MGSLTLPPVPRGLEGRASRQPDDAGPPRTALPERESWFPKPHSAVGWADRASTRQPREGLAHDLDRHGGEGNRSLPGEWESRGG
jgi:hypothetical protein